MTLIHRTREWPGYSKGSHYWNEYHLEGETVVKYKCGSSKFFDGKENIRETSKDLVESWSADDPNMPDWLRNKVSGGS
ncbi:hypothetical protein [Microbacterium testaceum]|uniref:hypothetical protein n=1 Tax=Microbacterium testaceum TaxID=2033 RepID=UPI0009BEA87B|nr:hypothetical protein [Microbacterium testaceum]